MERQSPRLFLIPFVITLAVSGLAVGQDSVALSVEPSALSALETGGIAEGQKVKIEGIVIKRTDQSFTVCDAKGTETVVVVTDQTLIKTERKRWFHRGKSSSADGIRCGLRLKVEGHGNSDNQLVAKNITINEPDLKTAENDQTRITGTENGLGQAVQSAATLWTIRTVEHCCRCSSCCGEDCDASCCRGRGGCPCRRGCNQNEYRIGGADELCPKSLTCTKSLSNASDCRV
jgi:hypothetical protein